MSGLWKPSCCKTRVVAVPNLVQLDSLKLGVCFCLPGFGFALTKRNVFTELRELPFKNLIRWNKSESANVVLQSAEVCSELAYDLETVNNRPKAETCLRKFNRKANKTVEYVSTSYAKPRV